MKNNKHKDKETEAVRCFLKNSLVNFKEEDIRENIEQSSIVDVRFKNLSFQIKFIPAEAEKVDGQLDKKATVKLENVGGEWFEISKEVGKIKKISWHFSPEESWEKFIYRPLMNVLKKYGENASAAKGVILLLYGRNMLDCPFLSDLLQEFSKMKFLSEVGKKTNFDSIYFVGWEENIQLYPLPTILPTKN